MSETRTKMISIKLTPTEFRELKELCADRNCTMTALLVSTLGCEPTDARRNPEESIPQFARR